MFLGSLLHPFAWLLHPTARMTIPGIYALLITACCLLAIPIWRILGAPYALYTLASVLVPLLTYPTTNSGGRYVSVACPVLIMLALALRRWPALREPVLLVFACLLTIFAIFFASGRGIS
jgi:hypothetical protein